VAHGTQRYFDTLRLLREGMFQPNVAGVAVAAVTSVGIVVAGSLMMVENESGKGRVEVGNSGGVKTVRKGRREVVWRILGAIA
jgi:hypothetical protein